MKAQNHQVRCDVGKTHKTQPWPGQADAGMGSGDRGGPGTATETGREREDWELNILEEMSGRQAKISAPAQGD